MEQWKQYKLSDICDLIAGFAFKSVDFGTEGAFVVKIKDIQPPFVNLDDADKVNLTAYDTAKLKKFLISKGDVLLAMTGATIGKIEKYIIVKPNSFTYNPARVNIGSIGRNTFGFNGCVSPVYVVFSCENGYHYFFDMYRHLQIFKDEIITRSIGGVRQTLNYADFALI